jgi:hypothetical protein
VRLLCLHADTIRALASLHAPFDDLTPDGLWGTEYHLIGVTADQRDVLRGFGIDLEDVTPASLEGVGGARAGAPRTAAPTPRPLPRVEPLVSRDQIRPRDAAPVPTREPSAGGGQREQGTQSGQTGDRSTPQASATNAPQASAPGAGAGQDVSIARTKAPSGGGVATRAPMKLRTRFKGAYKEASVRDGKIHLDGNKFDSPQLASKSLSSDKKDWELWEYYDEDAGKWYMLDREWENA